MEFVKWARKKPRRAFDGRKNFLLDFVTKKKLQRISYRKRI